MSETETNTDTLTLSPGPSPRVTRPIHLLNELARRKAAMSAAWEPYRYEHKTPGDPIPPYTEVEGAVAPPFQSGPRKGRPNWAKMDKATVRVVAVTRAEADAFGARWEAETGRCRECVGEGRRLAGWSREAGQSWRPCRACGGTGKAVGK